MGEFYKQMVLAANELHLAPSEELRNTWLQKDYATYIELVPSDALEEAFNLTKLGLSRKKRLKFEKQQTAILNNQVMSPITRLP